MSEWGRRVCIACGKDLNDSRNQWQKGVGMSRCKCCIHEGITRDSDGFETARGNNTTRIDIDIDNVFAEGSFKYCALGTYRGGHRTGQNCVAKYFKDDDGFEGEFFDRDLAAVEQTLRIVTQWNQAKTVPGFVIIVNVPEIFTCDGRQCMIEPHIDGFMKFNSNSGWVKRGVRGDIMNILQALSHYSHRVYSGQLVICDLQGVIAGIL